jgi:HlyD family secretion protein
LQSTDYTDYTDYADCTPQCAIVLAPTESVLGLNAYENGAGALQVAFRLELGKLLVKQLADAVELSAGAQELGTALDQKAAQVRPIFCVLVDHHGRLGILLDVARLLAVGIGAEVNAPVVEQRTDGDDVRRPVAAGRGHAGHPRVFQGLFLILLELHAASPFTLEDVPARLQPRRYISQFHMKRGLPGANLLYTGVGGRREELAKTRVAWLTTVPVVMLAGLFIYFVRPEPGEPVRVAEVRQETLVSSLTTNGKVEATEARELRAEEPGFVRRVAVKEGDTVRAGQLLIELDRGQAQAEAAKAQAELDAARAELQVVTQGGSAAELQEDSRKLREARAARDEAAAVLAANERLLERNAIARLEVDQSRERWQQAGRDVAYFEKLNANRFSKEDRRRAAARVHSAEEALDYARRQLGVKQVQTPLAGVVYSLPTRVGNYVNTGDVLARVGRLDRVRVRVFVDEPELGRVTVGQQVRVGWTALPGMRWQGTVERIPAEVTTLGTRSVGEVICTIGNSERKLLANVNVDVEIISATRPDALTLPKEAIVHAGDTKDQGPHSHFVFVVENNVLHRRPVQLGVSNATRFEITSGVQVGQKVAIPGDHPLEDGMKVKVVG